MSDLSKAAAAVGRESLSRARQLIDLADERQHRYAPDDADLLTEIADEFALALTVVEAALALDEHSQGWPPLVPPSRVGQMREAIAPYRFREGR